MKNFAGLYRKENVGIKAVSPRITRVAGSAAMAQALARTAANRLGLTIGVSGRPSMLVSSRGFSADHHGPKKVNMWEAPLKPAEWKEEHFVFASLGGWGLLFYAGYKAASGGGKKKAPGGAEEAPHAEGGAPAPAAEGAKH